ncbi:hypothetical protein AB0L41_28545 [Amycolatopsis mediterranei]|uniref:hypothetical protein n=1 Tax=Amycolatopsis mediterranei TaxID=33910 RepID=UPI003445B8C7
MAAAGWKPRLTEPAHRSRRTLIKAGLTGASAVAAGLVVPSTAFAVVSLVRRVRTHGVQSVAGRDPAASKPAAPRPARRKLFADYLTDARAAWTPGVEITPAWVREATGCSRGLSSRLAAALAT